MDSADGGWVADEPRFQDALDPGGAPRRGEGRVRIREGPGGIVGRDDQTAAAVQVPFHEVPLGRVEGRVLLQPDLPEDRATGLKHGEARKTLVRGPPKGM